MKQRGMLFTQSLIPALLSGAKTQTRRLMRKQPADWWMDRPLRDFQTGRGCTWADYWDHARGRQRFWVSDPDTVEIKPPHAPGDLIWVREAFVTHERFDGLKPSELPDDAPICFLSASGPVRRKDWVAGRYRNARFMPKALARIWLRVLDVRPERSQDITEEDALAEGVESMECGGGGFRVDSGWSYRRGFAHVWGRLHKPPNAWADNRWIWAYTLERTERPS